MFKTIGLMALVICFSSSMAFADNGYNPKPHKPHHRPHKPHKPNGGTWNYNYSYEYENKTKFYNDPYFWGSALGVLDDIITAPRGEVYVQPGPVYAQPPVIYPQASECFTARTQVYIPYKGYVPYQTVVCP